VGQSKSFHLLTLLVFFAMLAAGAAFAAPLMEEGFPYPVGSGLATNGQWLGAASQGVAIVRGNLSEPTLGGTSPAGNMLQLTSAATANAYRNFSPAPITGGTIYFAALLNCAQIPSSSQAIAGLLSAGSTSLNNAPDDPLDFYINNATNGFTFSISHTGADPVRTRTVLATNTTHFIVMKYLFGSGGRASIYVDPVPGNPEPASAAAATEYPGEGTDPINLQVMLLRPLRSGGTGMVYLDTLRIGTNWADVASLPIPVSVTGPADEAVCFGSTVMLTTSVAGTAPFSYLWRTNGVPVLGATNASFTVTNASAASALPGYDLIVNDAFGSVTSRVAKLTITTQPASIAINPTNQIIWPGISNATFSVTAAGDAPITYQWRTNGVPIPGATNSTYTLTNVNAAAASNSFDLVAANPCGSATSTPPVQVVFPNAFLVGDALPGFFSGMNLFATNAGGSTLYAWSSPDPTVPLPLWTLEGLMQEQPLNDGTGNSRYSINVNPMVSPVYYVIGSAIAPPYIQPVPVEWITTDALGNYYLFTSSVALGGTGVLQFPVPPTISQGPSNQTVLAGQTVNYSVSASGSMPIAYQWYLNPASPLPNATNAALVLPNVGSNNVGSYFVTVSNAYGSTSSAPATLNIVLPPQLSGSPGEVGIQISALGTPGVTYLVQAAADLTPPVNWVTLSTNVTDLSGLGQFSEVISNQIPGRFYRIQFP
jgi:hypothetical protein